MRLALCIFLLTVRICQASEPSRAWSDWVSEGKALRSAGNYFAAAHAFREALAIADHSDIDERQLVVLHHALAAACAGAGQFAESEAEYRRALALVEMAEGRGSLHYAILLGDIAILPAQTGNRDEVIGLLRQAIAVNARIGSAEDIWVARERLADILTGEKRYQDAEPLLLEALADLAKQKAPAPALLAAGLNNLAVLRFHQERYKESVDLQQQSIRIYETALGKENPSLVSALNNLAITYVKMEDFEDAEGTLQRAIDVCGKTLGKDHLNYAALLENYAVVLRKLGRKREAKKFKTKADQIEQAFLRRNGVGATISVSALRSDPR